MPTLNPERESLVLAHMPLVRVLALQMCRRVPPQTGHEDLMQQGMLGLVTAAIQYNPERNVEFGAFARIRIKGAMVDYLRDYCDPLHRSHRREIKAGREPEVVFQRMALDTRNQHVAENLPDPNANPHPAIETREIADRAMRAPMSERERRAVELLVFEECTYNKAAAVMGICATRVWQLRNEAIDKMRAAVNLRPRSCRAGVLLSLPPLATQGARAGSARPA